MSVKALADYTLYAKYAQYLPAKKRRETWSEIVERVFAMHEKKLGDKLEAIREEFEFAKEAVKKKKVLGSQRALQFGGDSLLKKQAKLYNCCASYADRHRFFQETMYLLLCGCGVGFSVQRHHVAQLPKITARTKGKKQFLIPDSIEGWADTIGVLLQSYFVMDEEFFVYDLQSHLDNYSGYEIEFDFSLIRPEGAPISWGGKAPGPKGLQNAVGKIEKLLNSVLESGKDSLDPIHVYDIVMHTSDAVLSGGIRRSASVCLFSPDDRDMITAKTGNWIRTNPQRGRSNNSALLVRSETTREQFSELMKSVKEFGEPGFVWSEDRELLVNPCVEIGFLARTKEGKSGWNVCNLCEINGKKATTEEAFLEACRAAAILGTIQASYDTFSYLPIETSEIVKSEALLGVSMTGIMDSPEICLNPEIQRKGAQLILEVNKKISALIGINPCARATAIKPAGTTSCILGTASGIHPHHANRYIRRVQANKLEFPAQYFAKLNPKAVEKSVWSNNDTDLVLSFLCEVPTGAKTKNQIGAIDLLKTVQLTQQNWIEYGTRHEACLAPWLRHNVSNTCFSAREKFITSQGLRSFGEFKDGDFVTVYDFQGKARCGIIKNFGSQEIYELTVADGKNQRIIETTKNHIWLTCNKRTKFTCQKEEENGFVGNYRNAFSFQGYMPISTTNLLFNQNTQLPKVLISKTRNFNNEAYCHGYVFGDGSKHYKTDSKTHVRIYDNSIESRESIAQCFLKLPNISCLRKEDHIYIGCLPKHWKNVPVEFDVDYLFSFIAGWFAADGYIADPEGDQYALSLTHKSRENMEWLYRYAPMAGIIMNPIKGFEQKMGFKPGETYYRTTFNKSSLEDSFFVNHADKYRKWLIQKNKTQNAKYFRPLKVVATGRYEQVYCVVEPETSTFLLEGNLLTHNCSVLPEEWSAVEEYIYENRKWFAGVSLLSQSGDLDYPQAPFATILTSKEIVQEFGEGSLLVSGLVVDGLAAFDNNLWAACDSALGIGEKIDEGVSPEEPVRPTKNGYTDKQHAEKLIEYASNLKAFYDEVEKYHKIQKKLDWIRRFKQFANRYVEGNQKKCSHLLKHVYNYKTWLDLKRQYVDIDWSLVTEEKEHHIEVNTIGAEGCSGGKCDLGELGKKIEETQALKRTT